MLVGTIAWCVRHAANFNCGRRPARAASRISRSRLNKLIFPRFKSETRACVIPNTLAACVCVISQLSSQRSSPTSNADRITSASASASGNRSKNTLRPAGVTCRGACSLYLRLFNPRLRNSRGNVANRFVNATDCKRIRVSSGVLIRPVGSGGNRRAPSHY